MKSGKKNKIPTKKNYEKKNSRIRSKHSQSEANVKEVDAQMLRLIIDIVEMLCDIDIKMDDFTCSLKTKINTKHYHY